MKNSIAFLLLCISIYSKGQSLSPSNTRFQEMLNNYYEAFLQLNPTTASYKGDYRYNDQMENSISQPYRDQSKALYSRFQDSIRSFSFQQLSTRDQLSYQIFEYTLKNSLEELQLTNYFI